MLLTVRDRPGFCLSATVPSALNLATIKRIQRGEGWFIFLVQRDSCSQNIAEQSEFAE